MSIWDINSAQRFRFMSSTFFRGAVACLLFYDTSVSESFRDLNYWLEQIRSHSGQIPIFLIAFKSDIKEKINLEELSEFVEANEISRFYLISSRKKLKTLQIFNNIVSRIFEHIVYYRPENLKLSAQEKQLYQTFLVKFSRCPICLEKNHHSNLNRVFFSEDPLMRRLKANLIELMEGTEFFDEPLVGKIKIGIPCCRCFKKVFEH
jgi:GTPase SAR1 family protein